jgi:prophage antirepressor-like protein
MASLPVSSDTAFQFEGRNVRLVEQDGETWFVATDVARELGYRDAADLTRILEADEKGTHNLRTLGGDQEVAIISEPGVYRAIVQRRSNKKHDESLTAKLARFQRFVFHDVLPQIARTGSYSPPAPEFVVPQTKAEALRLAADLAEQVEKQQIVIDGMKPKADFHDAVAEAENCQEMQVVAKVLGTGRTRLFYQLRQRGLLMAGNLPYQQYIDAGYFRVVERIWRDPDQKPHTTFKTLVTGKGLAYIQKLLAPSTPPASQAA